MELESHTFFHALSDPTRLRCLAMLHAQGELCVCELTRALGLSQPKISRHLA
ncbi:MAG: ArsR/SmtB family transcription factor, partial [Halothiobacillaceae bacterium]